jgi:hypothetical protein
VLAPEFGERAIRYSLALVALSSLWSAAHNALSARAIPDALRQTRG